MAKDEAQIKVESEKVLWLPIFPLLSQKKD
jgi:hypothetical protein